MNISIIDDEVVLASRIKRKLEKNGYGVTVYNSLQEFINHDYEERDLYIIDLCLGDGSGFEIIKWLRNEKHSSTPIIIMSGYNDTEKKVYGLDLGADDYLAKPFQPEELIARVKALSRRNPMLKYNGNIQYKNICLNLNSKEVQVGGKKIHLTKTEDLIVELFLSNIGKLVQKDEFIQKIWGEDGYLGVSDNTINVTISKVRKKLGDDFSLKTKINKGYILEL
ncbi:response regulator transcription factor [Candidatus Gracilibacteria bacterium 28_42_T64]|nr:response regulator transcription factor [Candidatus Gracilibacteria bacterium 28_42_T64]